MPSRRSFSPFLSFRTLPVPPAPFPVVGGNPGELSPWSPASSAASPSRQDPVSCPRPASRHQSSGTSSSALQSFHCFLLSFLLHWKRATNNVSGCSTLSQPACTLCLQRHSLPSGLPPLRVGVICALSTTRLPAPPPTGVCGGGKVEVLLDFLGTF